MLFLFFIFLLDPGSEVRVRWSKSDGKMEGGESQAFSFLFTEIFRQVFEKKIIQKEQEIGQ